MEPRKKIVAIALLLLSFGNIHSQVGINTTNPNSMLDVRASDSANPTPTDGILIPKIGQFPTTDPGLAQDGMLVYLTSQQGSNLPGFYFWKNADASWVALSNANSGTLDNAYNFGGPGLGRNITANNGAVSIVGSDGLVVSGTPDNGVTMPATSGTKMIWNPRKSAFRAGTVVAAQWSDANTGYFSTAFGGNATASGTDAMAFGTSTTASGTRATAFGTFSTASGLNSTTFGTSTFANATNATAFGFLSRATNNETTAFGVESEASGYVATAFGSGILARSFGETAMGTYNTDYTPSSITAWSAQDRIFSLGNGVSNAARSDAMTVFKNGLATLPSVTNALITAEPTGKAIVTKEWMLSNRGGTLDQAYDFGTAGGGRTITADSGPVTIDGTDGFVATGVSYSGATMPETAGTAMIWNPRKSAFRAGTVDSAQWSDANTGFNSTAFGNNTTASGGDAAAFGRSTTASGWQSTAFGDATTASGGRSMAFGYYANASGEQATAFGLNSNAQGNHATAFGTNTTASSLASTAFGFFTNASGYFATAFGSQTNASGNNATAFGSGTHASQNESTAFGSGSNASGSVSTAFGHGVFSKSYGEMAIGLYNTIYFPSSTGWFGTDRIFSIGNGVAPAGRSDALTILKNGLATLPSVTNALINAEPTGKAIVTKEWALANRFGTLDQAYDFATPGGGRTITADNGAVTINGTDGLVVSGTFNGGVAMPATTGTQLIWNPRKSAFRAGTVNAAQWSDANTGYYSAAFGGNNTASGQDAMAFGTSSVASGSQSTAFGNASLSSGNQATAFGVWSNATGNQSTAFGQLTSASAERALAFGAQTQASGVQAAAFGYLTTASGYNSTAFGWSSFANQNNATAFGYQTRATSQEATAFGFQSQANGARSTAFGEGSIASNVAATAFGWATEASGQRATAFGYQTVASSNQATAFGSQSTASGQVATAFGQGVTARSCAETATGINNVEYTPGSTSAWVATDRIFSVGNGSAANARSNAMTILKNGRVGIGSTLPRAPLHVTGQSDLTNALNIRYFNSGSNLVTFNNWTGNTSAYFEGNVIATASFVGVNTAAWSDSRLKKISGISDGKRDLETLSKIEIVDYTMVDSISDPKRYKKIVAQQVEKLMPDAVGQYSNYLPSVYRKADRVTTIGTAVTISVPDHGFVAGDQVKLISETKGDILTTVTRVIDRHTFSIETSDQIDDNLFVYGKKVDDYRAVDYGAIAMLNVSATQELLRLLTEARNEVNEMKSKNEEMKAEFAEIKSEIASMKQLMRENQ
ncbi:hypothetical protein [Flavobacterium selenitireducens]|uniref:hypothetical protein n=1 Tax=Flavobacterium selenitireducens TaxID=2722704 RepID=UPI00168B32A3|nr:hypothetical protein [Flavobacterium selenitireducens]MBD3583514.1 hypothetical protein [Flavobacterium selenitireducens]